MCVIYKYVIYYIYMLYIYMFMCIYIYIMYESVYKSDILI